MKFKKSPFRYLLLFFLSAACFHASSATNCHNFNSKEEGYFIKIQCKGYPFKRLYLGHYFGSEFPIIDSAYINIKNEFYFNGHNKLPLGLYIVFDQERNAIFDLLISNEQHFGVTADFTDFNKAVYTFENSYENELLNKYLDFTILNSKKYDQIYDELMHIRSTSDSIQLTNKLLELDKEEKIYLKKIIEENKGTFLSDLLIGMQKPELPDSLKIQKNAADSLAARNFKKAHYWDGIKFWDGRFAFTPFFGPKLDTYFEDVLEHNEDSAIAKIDGMLALAFSNDYMGEFILKRLVYGSLSHKYKWGDEVFVHLFETYIAPKTYKWLSDYERKSISEKAYLKMSTLIGTPAPEIILPGINGKDLSLYSIQADFIVLAFWDPTCHHCRQTLPQMDSLYRLKWKNKGVKIFAFASESDGTISDWTSYISEHKLSEWSNVYCSIQNEGNRVNNGLKSFAQQYDVWYYPTFFLVDKNKRFMAKKLPYKQLVELVNSLIDKNK